MDTEEQIRELKECVDKLEDGQHQIKETLNNGLKSQSEENGKGLSKLEERFNKLLLAIGGGMFAIIMLLVQILMQTG